jgi:hypothetical protein
VQFPNPFGRPLESDAYQPALNLDVDADALANGERLRLGPRNCLIEIRLAADPDIDDVARLPLQPGDNPGHKCAQYLVLNWQGLTLGPGVNRLPVRQVV